MEASRGGVTIISKSIAVTSKGLFHQIVFESQNAKEELCQ
jgi:hypothetical protein